MTNRRFMALVNGQKWTFAKTMAAIPHWYIVRKNMNDSDFVDMVKHIREFGVQENFGRRTFTYFYINGYKYWTMGEPINLNGAPHTIIINRAKYEPKECDYDHIANDYVKHFSDNKFSDEDSRLFALIRKHISGRVLDIGCGAGLLIDNCPSLSADYVGVDESIVMLENFSYRHPSIDDIIHDRFRNVECGLFDTIVALYGTASYFDGREVDLVVEYLKPGGKYVLMTYAPEYYPVTHEMFDIPYNGPGVNMPYGSHVTRFGNYDIHTNFVL